MALVKSNLPSDGSLSDIALYYNDLFHKANKTTTGNLKFPVSGVSRGGFVYNTSGTVYDNTGEIGLLNLIYQGDSLNPDYSNPKMKEYLTNMDIVNYINGLEDNIGTMQTDINSQLEGKVSKPLTATDGNIAVFDTDQDAIKDSGLSAASIQNFIGSKLDSSISTFNYFIPGYGGVFSNQTSVSIIGTVRYFPIYVEKTFTASTISAYRSNTTNSNLKVALYMWDNGLPSTKITSDYTIFGGTTTGIKETIINLEIERGLYFVGAVAETNFFSGTAIGGATPSPFTTVRDTTFIASNYIYEETSASLPLSATPTTVGNVCTAILFKEA